MSQVSNSISIFKDMAEAISAKYLAHIKLMEAEAGARPPFDDLMVQLKLMEKELTSQGVKFIEKFREPTTNRDSVTNDLREIIRTTIEGFIRQL